MKKYRCFKTTDLLLSLLLLLGACPMNVFAEPTDTTMHRKLKKLLILVLSVVLLTSCQGATSFSLSSGEVGENAPPNNRKIYEFDSVRELVSAFSPVNPQNWQLKFEKDPYGDNYALFLDQFKSDMLVYPMINGEEMPLRNNEESNNISFFTKEIHNLPWIWYNCLYQDENVQIRIAYPALYMEKDLGEYENFSTFLTDLNSDFPIESYVKTNADGTLDYTRTVTVTKTELTLKDKNVSALVYMYSYDGKTKVHFLYDDVYVLIYANADLLTEEFWNAFSLE